MSTTFSLLGEIFFQDDEQETQGRNFRATSGQKICRQWAAYTLREQARLKENGASDYPETPSLFTPSRQD